MGNGGKFQEWVGMMRAVTGDGTRTNIYYCHPYSAFEREQRERKPHDSAEGPEGNGLHWDY